MCHHQGGKNFNQQTGQKTNHVQRGSAVGHRARFGVSALPAFSGVPRQVSRRRLVGADGFCWLGDCISRAIDSSKSHLHSCSVLWRRILQALQNSLAARFAEFNARPSRLWLKFLLAKSGCLHSRCGNRGRGRVAPIAKTWTGPLKQHFILLFSNP